MFGPHSKLHVDGRSFELIGRYLGRPLSHAEIQELNWFQVAVALYCVWLIINILIELKFYKERGFDLKADNGKRYPAQIMLSSLFTQTDIGLIKLFSEGAQLLIGLLYVIS
jgi:transcriptional regulator CtsR